MDISLSIRSLYSGIVIDAATVVLELRQTSTGERKFRIQSWERTSRAYVHYAKTRIPVFVAAVHYCQDCSVSAGLLNL